MLGAIEQGRSNGATLDSLDLLLGYFRVTLGILLGDIRVTFRRLLGYV